LIEKSVLLLCIPNKKRKKKEKGIMRVNALPVWVVFTSVWPWLVPADGIRLKNGHENVLIQAWGHDGFRIRATLGKLPDSVFILGEFAICRN
jgi:hypothetical protein